MLCAVKLAHLVDTDVTETENCSLSWEIIISCFFSSVVSVALRIIKMQFTHIYMRLSDLHVRHFLKISLCV